MENRIELGKSIRQIAKERFSGTAIEEFLETFQRLASVGDIIDSILQISTDEGDELEIGFFTKDVIADITLSNGKVYSYTYPLFKVHELQISDLGTKWTLTIKGEKKFDYNVVKPGNIDILQKYEASLLRNLALTSE